MAVIHRALYTWFMVLIFAILLVLKLDDKAMWNTFIIFVPMWLFDSTVVIYLVFHMIKHCKYRYDAGDTAATTMPRKVWFLLEMMLKLAFQLLICIKLEYYPYLSMYIVMIPAWLLLTAVTGDVTRSLVNIHR